MLDLRVLEERTTQGRPPAEMTLAANRPTGLPTAGPVAEPPAPAPAPAAVDPRAVADRVYALLQAELRQLRQRRGGRCR